jgi:KDO2-lipid IV(A) lauroyltransferase
VRLKAALAAVLADGLRGTPRALEGPLSAALGGLLFATYERSVALSNLERAFPEWSAGRRRRTALASYRHTARALLEVLHSDRYGDEGLRDRVEIEGIELLADPVAEGRGALLLTGHYGNWEWLARRVAGEGLPFTALYKEPKDPDLGERLRSARAGSGVEYVPHEDVRTSLRRLRAGRVLGIVMDQEPKRLGDGAVAPLFGLPTLTFVAPFRLARLTGARVVTAFCRGVGPGRYRAVFEPFEPSGDPDPDRAAAADAAAFNARLEAAIRAAPEQWTWTYRRWKRIERGRGKGG